MPQSNSYTECELFASGMDRRVLETVILQGDLEALLSIRAEEETQYEEESETTRRRPFGCEFRKVEPGRGQQQQGGPLTLGARWESCISGGRSQTLTVVKWPREAKTSLHLDSGPAGSLNADMEQAVVELLRRSCGRGPSSEAKQTLADNKTIV